ncbi:hypothetical protein Tco_0210822 [Tanacetum coccineum]
MLKKTSLNKQKAVETNQNVIAPGILRAASSLRRPSNRYSPFKNNVFSNTKKSSEKEEVYVRINKKKNVASKNVVSDKKIVTDVDVKNALKAKDVLCVSCTDTPYLPDGYGVLVFRITQLLLLTLDGTLEIKATIDTIRYTISEASIRDSLQLDDATGITMLPNDELFEGMGQIGYPTD